MSASVLSQKQATFCRGGAGVPARRDRHGGLPHHGIVFLRHYTRSLWLLLLVVCPAVMVTSAGCAVAADLLNPVFLSSLGFDPATIIPPQGRTLVAFVNDTQFDADFSVVATADPLATTVEYEVEWGRVAPSETMLSPFDCPIAVILPGALNDDGSISQTAVTVITAGGDVPLTYSGSALESGPDFVCGDLIEVRLVQVGDAGAAAADFAIQVRVLPGS